MEIYLRKANGCLIPDTDQDLESLKAFKTGEVIRVDPKRPRNYQFHRKLFALFNHAYSCWEPDEGANKYGPVNKSFERFRQDLVILAGFYEQVVRLDGTIRVEAKSISYASMSADEFEELYDKMVDVVLKHVLKNYTRDDLENVIAQTLEFAT